MDIHEFAVVTRYDPETGQLLAIRDGTWGSIIAEPYAFVLGEHDLHKQYVGVGTKEVRKRPRFSISRSKKKILADGGDLVVFRNIPPGTAVEAAGSLFTVEDGIFEFGAALPGIYIVRFSLWPYLDDVCEVVAE